MLTLDQGAVSLPSSSQYLVRRQINDTLLSDGFHFSPRYLHPQRNTNIYWDFLIAIVAHLSFLGILLLNNENALLLSVTQSASSSNKTAIRIKLNPVSTYTNSNNLSNREIPNNKIAQEGKNKRNQIKRQQKGLSES